MAEFLEQRAERKRFEARRRRHIAAERRSLAHRLWMEQPREVRLAKVRAWVEKWKREGES